MAETDRTGRRFGTPVLAIVAVIAFVLGALVGWALLADVGETPCWEVRGRIEPVRDVLTETDGAGDAGQAAARSVAQTAAEHPDCFSPEERAYFDDLRDTGATGPATDEATGPSTLRPSPTG